MNIERCINCEGRKMIIGMGNIEKKCEACDGVGYKEVAKVEQKKKGANYHAKKIQSNGIDVSTRKEAKA